MKKYAFIISLIIGFGISLAQQTKLLTAEKHNEYGLIYSLPITSFQVEITVVKETKIAGPYSKYAKVFTSTDKVITKDETNWTIESVNVIPYGVADSENRYLMQLKPGATTYIEVADDGMILSINKEIKYESPQEVQITSIEGKPYNGKEFLEFVNEDFIAAQSSYHRAQLLAEEIMEVRDARISLTRGTAETMPTDGRQLEIMLASLADQEKALMNAFTGSSWKERITRTFTFLPQDEGQDVLCSLDPLAGLVDAKPTKGAKPIYISVKATEEAQLPVDSKGEEKKLPKDAVIYCVPGTAEISISFNSNIYFQKEFPMSQFGILFGLNPSIFSDKKEPSYAIFDPTTGALKEIGILK